MIAVQPVDRRKPPTRIGPNRVYPIHMLGIGAGLENQTPFQQQGAIHSVDREPVACEACYRTGRAEVVGWLDHAVYFERYLLPAALKHFQVAPGLRVHSDGWFFARFFHL